MPTLVSSVSPHEFPFTAAVRSRSWDWLYELRRRLNVEVQLVNEQLAPALPQLSGHVAGAVSRWLAADQAEVRMSVSDAIRTRGVPFALVIDNLQIVCFGLATGRAVNGALILARELTGHESTDHVRVDLESIGSWLSAAVEAHLTSEPTAEGEDLIQVSSLCRVLTDAARGGADRLIVAAFVEALAVWNDLDVFGYVATVSGQYVLDVSMPGADRTKVRTTLDSSAVPGGADLIRLTRSDSERLEFDANLDVVMMPIARQHGTPRWLIVLDGPPESRNDARLSLYAKLLDHWVGQLLTQSASRVTVALAL